MVHEYDPPVRLVTSESAPSAAEHAIDDSFDWSLVILLSPLVLIAVIGAVISSLRRRAKEKAK